MKILFVNMTVELNLFDISKQPLEYDEVRSVCLIEESSLGRLLMNQAWF